MKEPKTFKYPRLYARLPDKSNNGTEVLCYLQRVRIIYPNGIAPTYSTGEGCSLWYIPCWCYDLQATSPSKQIEAMKRYDRCAGHRTIFLGEIK